MDAPSAGGAGSDVVRMISPSGPTDIQLHTCLHPPRQSSPSETNPADRPFVAAHPDPVHIDPTPSDDTTVGDDVGGGIEGEESDSHGMNNQRDVAPLQIGAGIGNEPFELAATRHDEPVVGDDACGRHDWEQWETSEMKSLRGRGDGLCIQGFQGFRCFQCFQGFQGFQSFQGFAARLSLSLSQENLG